MPVINTNISALYTNGALQTSGRETSVAMRQLSTGLRINSARDDAAGLAISDRMSQQIRSLNQAVRNAGDAISLIQTAEGSTSEVSDMLQRMRELSVQAATDTNNAEQRGYLDLEFQQLKQEIVRITEATDWNGYSLLDGTAGERVGEMPVYKITSNGKYGSVFVDPTTTRTMSGTDTGEQQTITLTGTASAGTIKVAGIDVPITAAEATQAASDAHLGVVTAKIKTTLEASPNFDASSGRSVTVTNSTVVITYGPTEGDVSNVEVVDGAGLTSAKATTRTAIATAGETFASNGKFLQSGTLAFSVTSASVGAGVVTANFTNPLGEVITLTGTLNGASTAVTFTATSGRNSEVISDNVTYAFNQGDGSSIAATNRAVGMSVAVSGTAPAMQTGDLQINGIEIGSSYAADDRNSPLNNAAGSAIAKAAAINRQTANTGVVAKVNENIMTGQAMDASSVVVGQIFVNGFATATITSSLSNTRETRSDVVRAINAITYQTGVKAVDTGSEAEGVTLTAADGRNIEIRFETSASSRIFGTRVGLREGVQAGTYSLESKVEDPVVVTTSSTGQIARAGLKTGDYTVNESRVITIDRDSVMPSKAQAESVVIAGVVTTAKKYSITINGTKYEVTSAATDPQSVRKLLIAAAANDQNVTVSAGNSIGELIATAKVPGTAFTLTVATEDTVGTISANTIQENYIASPPSLNAGDLELNGIHIGASKSGSDELSGTTATSSARGASAIAIAAAINAKSQVTGVTATANGAVVQGSYTDTASPSTSGVQSIFINGVEISVNLTKDELGSTRRGNVVTAINQRSGQHGITATDNGRGITLTSDGRNLSVWIDGDDAELHPANFGLSNNDEVAQVSTITFGAPANNTDVVSVVINGQTISATTGNTTAAAAAAALATAISTAKNAIGSAPYLKNITVADDGAGKLTISSDVAGTAFTVTGAKSETSGGVATTGTVTVQAIANNSLGTTQIDVVRGGNTATSALRTWYGGITLTSDSAMLPPLPQPIGAPPPDVPVGLPIEVGVGSRGYGQDSSFRALGFQEGVFGGKSSAAMEPPRVARLSFQVGASADQKITVDFSDFGKDGPITSEVTGDVDKDLANRTVRIHTREGANAVVTKLDSVLDKVNQQRAVMGAVMSRLEHVIDNLMNVSMNTEASRSQIRDADYAQASTELARSSIMQQASMAVLAQANASQQNVLKLLQ
jgi:flagellin